MDTKKLRIASVSDVPPGTGKEVAVGGRVIALFHIDGQFFAIDGICAHAGGPVGKGELAGHTVTCPWHGWQYDVRTGQHCLNARICQESFPVCIAGDEVFVELPV